MTDVPLSPTLMDVVDPQAPETVSPPEGKEVGSPRARLRPASRINQALRRYNRTVRALRLRESTANSPYRRAAHERRELRRKAVLKILYSFDYTPRELVPNEPKLARRAARAQLRETNKWATWRELAAKHNAKEAANAPGV